MLHGESVDMIKHEVDDDPTDDDLDSAGIVDSSTD